MICLLVALITLVSLSSPASARPAVAGAGDPVKAVAMLREKGCKGRRGIATPLRADARLGRIAARMAEGATLAEAVEAEKYAATRWTSIHINRAANTAALLRLVERRWCEEITDDAFQTIGAARRDGHTWLVLAAPSTAPQIEDARATASRVLELVNAARSRPRLCGTRRYAAATALTLDATLGRVADAHARDMAARGRMSHVGSDGTSVADRVARAGYPWRVVAENVAAGQSSADTVVQTWLESPGHCANLMRLDVREMGVAWSFNAASEDGTYWAQVLAARR